MRLIFVNHAHPALESVARIRVTSFAESLSRKGHRVVLLTSTLPHERGRPPVPDAVSEALVAHDWSVPFHLACTPAFSWPLKVSRSQRVPSVIRRAFTVWNTVVLPGVHHDWIRGSRPYWQPLIRQFQPDLVWGTFGHTSNLELTKRLAVEAGCPWVYDIKDNLRKYVPSPLRALVRKRLAGEAGITSNSRHHARIAEEFFDRGVDVVYSGVHPAFFDRSATSSEAPVAADGWQLNLVGAVRDRELLGQYLRGVRLWIDRHTASSEHEVRLVYAGTSGALVSSEADRYGLRHVLVNRGQLPIERFAALCGQASVNSYIYASYTFHHKVLELLVAGPPVLAFPAEKEETQALAARCGRTVFVADSAEGLATCLEKLTSSRSEPTGSSGRYDDFSWDGLGDELVRSLAKFVGDDRVPRQHATAPSSGLTRGR